MLGKVRAVKHKAWWATLTAVLVVLAAAFGVAANSRAAGDDDNGDSDDDGSYAIGLWGDCRIPMCKHKPASPISSRT